MEKITKTEFINALMASPHDFMGVSYSFDSGIAEGILKTATPMIAGRTVTAKKSNHLEFSDDSRLYFDSFAKYTFRKADIDDTVIYEVEIRENGNDWSKFLYYRINHKEGD